MNIRWQSAISGRSNVRVRFELQYSMDFMKTIREEGLKKGKQLAKEEIRDLAKYLGKSLHNAPKRTRRRDTLRGKGNDGYSEGTQNMRIFFPDPKGGIMDSGMTSAELLQMLKGAYRAKGAGSFRKEKVQKRVRGTAPPGTYAERNQRPGEFFTKGTGRFSQKERARLEKIRQRKRKLIRTLRQKNRKADRKAMEKIRELEHKAEAALDQSEKKQRRLQERLTEKRRKAAEDLAKRNAARDQKLREFDERNRRYRIVVPNSRGGYVEKPLQKPIFRKSTPAGQMPRTWSGGGLIEYFISRNWKTEKVSDLEVEVSLKAKPFGNYRSADSDGFLHRLEHGGMMRTKPFVIGYLVVFQDQTTRKNGTVQKFSHRRVSIRPIMSDDPDLKSLRVPGRERRVFPHPFVSRTVEEVQKSYQSRNG